MQAPHGAFAVNPSIAASPASTGAANGFATGSSQLPSQALGAAYAAVGRDMTGRQPSVVSNHASPIGPTGGVLPTMQLSQGQQQALLQRSQQQGLPQAPPPPAVSAVPFAAPPPDRRQTTALPPAPAVNSAELPDSSEWKVPLRRATTVIRDLEPDEELPPISERDQHRVKQWLDRDQTYEDEVLAAGQELRTSMQALFNQAVRDQDWLGYPTDPQQSGPPRIQFPGDRAAVQARGARGQFRQPVPMSKSYARSISAQAETLIPIRLELEHEMWKLRDTFTWNLSETAITPQIFASHLCADLRLPREPFEREIVNAVSRQLADAQISVNYTDHLADPLTESREEGRVWLERHATKRRRVQRSSASGTGRSGGAEATPLRSPPHDLDDAASVTSVEELEDGKNYAAPTDELRLVIKLDVTLDAIQLVDQFEWDISEPNNSPEAFADAFAAELGLSGEFVTAISHSIREQIDFYTRSLCLLGYAPGRGIAEDDLRRDFLPPIQEPFRTDLADDFTPALNKLTADEVERHDREHEREVRRKRRQTKGRGVILPDREPIRTHRTLVPRPIPGYVKFEFDDRGNKVFPQPELALPYPLVAKPLPPKPAHLETISNSPLKLVPTKEKLAGSSSLAATAAANRYKRGLAEGGFAGDAVGAPPQPPPPKIDPASLGLHEYIIDGQWFCANCGCPGSIAVGRRKSPLGKESLCGECGKYYHRFKRQRPCTYTRDFDTHKAIAAKQNPAAPRRKRGRAPGGARVEVVAAEEAEKTRSARTSGRGTPASQALSPVSSAHEEESEDNASSAPSQKRKRTAQYGSPDRPFVQSDSGNSEADSDENEEGAPPPARRRSGTSTVGPTPPPPPPAVAVEPAPARPARAAEEPQPEPWMLAAAAELRAKHVDELFELIPRAKPTGANAQEWRLRCLDCVGKVYNLGPGQTLDGFTVHFKNRQHRQNVEARVARKRS